MKYTSIDAQLFVENRQRFVSKLKPKSIAFLNANDEMPRNGDTNFLFRQNSDLFYLTGIDQEQTILVLFPDAPLPRYKEILFVRKTNEHIAIWEGHKYTKDEARAASGIQSVYWLEDYNSIIPMLMNHCENVYVNINENDRFSSEVPYRDLRFAQSMKSMYAGHHFERLGPILASLRAIKHDIEIKLMQKAMDITEKAFRKVMRFVKPGVMEYEIEAEIIHEFIRKRASGHAYNPIIASGASACILHYNENNKECKAGDVILMDFGAEYANYAADLTRCIPVSGEFTQRQRDVYNAVLRVMKGATKMLVPGNTIEKYHVEVGLLMEAELLDLGLISKSDIKNQNPELPAYKKYFMHGTSHFLGLDVHDIGNRYEPMQPGMVFTCEPGIYIPEEGLGIRLENDILVTSKDPVDLMASIPVEIEDIEELMREAAEARSVSHK
ncbi:MAG: aminopeptidase P N-terminal domain-containing protein [Bacteroidia bacterium]|jgi:Xaa-Pro aminopeptidase|nr:aminopeptidase P N-terminal domain-containing protein [Bacteroidota bacterium]MBP7245348.1 aminopeptidase P N-terminal domain-containing protein [Bacteroidia bacterium]